MPTQNINCFEGSPLNVCYSCEKIGCTCACVCVMLHRLCVHQASILVTIECCNVLGKGWRPNANSNYCSSKLYEFGSCQCGLARMPKEYRRQYSISFPLGCKVAGENIYPEVHMIMQLGRKYMYSRLAAQVANMHTAHILA